MAGGILRGEEVCQSIHHFLALIALGQPVCFAALFIKVGYCDVTKVGCLSLQLQMWSYFS